MKTCGIGFKTTHSNNLKKKHMLTNRIKEVQEYVNEDPIYDKEPEMELVRKNSEFERKIKQGRKAKEIIEKRNLILFVIKYNKHCTIFNALSNIIVVFFEIHTQRFQFIIFVLPDFIDIKNG